MSEPKKGGCFRQFLLLLLIFCLFLAGIAIGGYIFFSSLSDTVDITDTTYLKFDCKSLAEYQQSSLFQFGESSNLFLLRRIMESSMEDTRIKGLVLNLSHLQMSQVHKEELVDLLKRFKAKGKKVYAYSNFYGLSQYYLASFADTIIMPDTLTSEISFVGYAFSSPYLKKLLDKLGITMQVVHIGKYKSAGENLYKESMSDAFRENIQSMIANLYDHRLRTICTNRKLDYEAFRARIMDGELAALAPREAQKQGLVDELAYYRQLEKVIDKKADDLNMVNIWNYPVKMHTAKHKVAVIFAEGEIQVGKSKKSFSPLSLGYTQVLGDETLVKQVENAAENDSIKAIILRVNSPGGSALASQIMYEAILAADQKKPVVVSMSEVAGSGGYYIAMGGRLVVAQPSTITGSIGVVGLLPDLKGLYEKAGINMSGFVEGKYADLGANSRGITEEEEQFIHDSMIRVYKEFKQRVAKNRGMAMEDVEKLAQGRVYTGLQAKNNNLIDLLGGMDKAIAETRKLLKIPADETVYLVKYPKEKGFFEKLQSFSIGAKSPDVSETLPVAKELTATLERCLYYSKHKEPAFLYLGPVFK